MLEVPIYLKTGMPYKDELDTVAKEHYCHVDVDALNNFLNSETAKKAAKSSDLLSQYREHIAEEVKKHDEAIRNWDMDWGPIQYLFAEKLISCTASDQTDVIWKARNRGGTCWTRYRFFGHHLFWRMDSEKPLRMMVDERNRPQNHSGIDVKRYQELFTEACKDADGIAPANFGFRRGNEMTIGAISYSNGQKIGTDSKMEAYLASVKGIHERFLERVVTGG